MKEFQVTCLNKTHRDGGHETITHIGNNSMQWRITKRSAIHRIKAKKEAFYMVEPVSGKRFYIGAARESWRGYRLRAHEEGVWNDHLLALSECTTDCQLL